MTEVIYKIRVTFFEQNINNVKRNIRFFIEDLCK